MFVSQADGRLSSQLCRLKDAEGYIGRLLLIEATDAEWRGDKGQSDDCDVGVKTFAEDIQAQFGELCDGYPSIRVLRVRNPKETAMVVKALMQEALEAPPGRGQVEEAGTVHICGT